MKKVLYFAALLLCTVMVSCDKDDVEGTAMESMAGQWYCWIDAVDDNGNPIDGGEDYWGLGEPIVILTYNVADNTEDEMWVNLMGNGNFADEYEYAGYPNYDIRAKVRCDKNALTFSATEAPNFAVTEVVDPMPVTIEGKILKGAGHQKNGSVADSIVFYVSYKDDPWYPDDGYAKYKVSGVRYSGLEEND